MVFQMTTILWTNHDVRDGVDSSAFLYDGVL